MKKLGRDFWLTAAGVGGVCFFFHIFSQEKVFEWLMRLMLSLQILVS